MFSQEGSGQVTHSYTRPAGCAASMAREPLSRYKTVSHKNNPETITLGLKTLESVALKYKKSLLYFVRQANSHFNIRVYLCN